ncbi:MAG: hypothetical protein ABI647_16565 [Gemmatimonadota bacterium]
MKRLVLVAALTACADAAKPTAPETTRATQTSPVPPIAGVAPAVVAEKFPEAASLGTGERAVWIVTNEAGALLAWGRGPAAAQTETTSAVNLMLRRRLGIPPAEELAAGRSRGLKMKSRNVESGAAVRPNGSGLLQPTACRGDAARMVSPDLKGVTLTRYRASGRPEAFVTVVTVVIASD